MSSYFSCPRDHPGLLEYSWTKFTGGEYFVVRVSAYFETYANTFQFSWRIRRVFVLVLGVNYLHKPFRISFFKRCITPTPAFASTHHLIATNHDNTHGVPQKRTMNRELPHLTQQVLNGGRTLLWLLLLYGMLKAE